MLHFKQRECSLIGEASLIGRKVKTSVFLQPASLTMLREVTHWNVCIDYRGGMNHGEVFFGAGQKELACQLCCPVAIGLSTSPWSFHLGGASCPYFAEGSWWISTQGAAGRMRWDNSVSVVVTFLMVSTDTQHEEIEKREDLLWLTVPGAKQQNLRGHPSWFTFPSKAPPPKGSLTFLNSITSWEQVQMCEPIQAFLIQTTTEFGSRHVQEGVAAYICSHCTYVSNLYLCALYWMGMLWGCRDHLSYILAGNCSHREPLKYLPVTPTLVCLLLLP